MATTIASAITPGSTPHHQHHYHYAQERIERSSPAMLYNSVQPTDTYLHTPTKTATVIRVVTKPIESIMVDGENPFRPEGQLFKEADNEIHELIRSQSVSPMPKQEIEEIVIPKELLDKEFPLLAGRNSLTATLTPASTSVNSHSTASSSSSSALSNAPKEPVNIQDERKSPQPTKNNEAVADPKKDQPTHEAKQIPSESDRDGKREKKKRKRNVGCGGDQSCSIV